MPIYVTSIPKENQFWSFKSHASLTMGQCAIRNSNDIEKSVKTQNVVNRLYIIKLIKFLIHKPHGWATQIITVG